MSSPYFIAGGFRKGFDGYSLFAADLPSAVGDVFAFPAETVRLSPVTGNAYPVLIDNNALGHNVTAGVTQARIQQSGPVAVDRGIAAFLNAAFGPRTNGQLSPWITSTLPYAGASVVTSSGIWWNEFTMSAAFSVRGDASPVKYELSGICLDPANVAAAPALTAPAASGTTGAGLSVFGQCRINDGASSPAAFDAVKSFKLTLKNNLAIQPVLKDTVHRIAAGCTPAPFEGKLEIVQLRGAVTALPVTSGGSTLDLIVPSGDAGHSLTIKMARNYDESDQVQPADDFTTLTAIYSLFGTSTVNGATFPFVAAYA